MNITELIEKARHIIEEADHRHHYSISAIYETHNAITGNNEKQQSCTTCLLNKVKEIRKWLTQTEQAPVSKNTETAAKASRKKRKNSNP